jgi:hypothetical protein
MNIIFKDNQKKLNHLLFLSFLLLLFLFELTYSGFLFLIHLTKDLMLSCEFIFSIVL